MFWHVYFYIFTIQHTCQRVYIDLERLYARPGNNTRQGTKMTENQWVKEEFEAGDLPLSGGDTLYSARLHYHQIGQLNAPRDNLILLPTYYGGAAEGNHPWVAPGSPLIPANTAL